MPLSLSLITAQSHPTLVTLSSLRNFTLELFAGWDILLHPEGPNFNTIFVIKLSLSSSSLQSIYISTFTITLYCSFVSHQHIN